MKYQTKQTIHLLCLYLGIFLIPIMGYGFSINAPVSVETNFLPGKITLIIECVLLVVLYLTD